MHAEMRTIKLDFEKNFTSNEPTVKAKLSTRGRKTFSQIEKEIEQEEEKRTLQSERDNKLLKSLSSEYAKRSKY